MKPFDRRDLLRWGLLGAGSTALGDLLSPFRNLAKVQTSGRSALPPSESKCLIVFLRGAACGLQTVVPFGDPSYSSVRGVLAHDISAGSTDVIPFAGSLDGFAKLHKSLAPLLATGGPAAMGRLAIATRVGNPLTNRSHFEQQDIWESAAMPAQKEGWVARLAGELGFDPEFPTASVSARLQRMFASTDPARRCVHVKSAADYSLTALDNLGPPTNPIPPQFAQSQRASLLTDHAQTFAPGLETVVAQTDQFAMSTESAVQAIAGTIVAEPTLFPQTDAEAIALGLPAYAPAYAFGRRCQEAVAILTSSLVNCRAAGIEIGGWDTHSDQMARRGLLDPHLHFLLASIYQKVRGRDITVMVVTEFGRQFAPNVDIGSDHGQGSNAIFMGAGVRRTGLWHCHGGTGLGQPWVRLDQIPLNPTPSPREPLDALACVTDWRAYLAEWLAKRARLSLAQIATVLPGFVPNTPGQPWTDYPNIFRSDNIGQ